MSDKDESVREGVSTKYDHEPLGTRSQSLAATDYSDDFTPFIDATELSQWSFWRAGIAEFVAAFLFLYILVQTVAGTTHLAGSGVGPQGIAWAAGGTIFVLVYCTAGISGGHINPAVTFGLFLARKVSLPRTILYILCQCLGAICGAGIVKGFQRDLFANSEGGANAIGNGYSWGDALGAEIIGTFMLVYTVFCATDAKRSARDSHVPVLAPLPIGFTVLVVHFATLPITGTGINPARSLGSAVIVNTDKVWDDHWIFWVGPLLGAALAAMYHILVIRALPFSRTRKYR